MSIPIWLNGERESDIIWHAVKKTKQTRFKSSFSVIWYIE